MTPQARRAILERRQRERAAQPTIAKPLVIVLSTGMFLAMAVIAAFMVPFVGGVIAAAKAAAVLGSHVSPS